MLRFLLILLIGSLMSCGIHEENPDYVDGPAADPDASLTIRLSSAVYSIDEAWICHHPGTKMHNQICIESEFPNGCYISGNRSAFCWLLLRPECERYYDNEETRAWQQDVCHHLE